MGLPSAAKPSSFRKAIKPATYFIIFNPSRFLAISVLYRPPVARYSKKKKLSRGCEGGRLPLPRLGRAYKQHVVGVIMQKNDFSLFRARPRARRFFVLLLLLLLSRFRRRNSVIVATSDGDLADGCPPVPAVSRKGSPWKGRVLHFLRR